MKTSSNHQISIHSQNSAFLILLIEVLSTGLDLGPVTAAMLFVVIGVTLGVLSKQKSVLTPISLVIFAYILAFPAVVLMPDYFQSLSRYSPSAQAIEKSMLWALRGFAMFALGYVMVEQKRGAHLKLKQAWHTDLFRSRKPYVIYVVRWAGLLACLAWVGTVVLNSGITMPGVTVATANVTRESQPNSLLQVFDLLSELRYAFFSLYLMLRYYQQTDRPLNLIFLFLLVVSVIEFMVSGSKGNLIKMLLSVLLSMSLLPVRMELRKVLMVVVSLFLIFKTFSVITEYRSIMSREYRAGANISTFEVQVDSFFTAVSNTFGLSESSRPETNVSSQDVASRFSGAMFSFANLLQFTNGQSPYENAWGSFLVPIYSLLPRALLPDKPVFFNAGNFAKNYFGWTNEGGVSVSLIGSLFFAWGYAGILLGMALIGSLLAYLVKYVRIWGLYSPGSVVILIVMIMQLLQTGLSIQALATNVIRSALVLWFLSFAYQLIHGRQMQKLRQGVSNIR